MIIFLVTVLSNPIIGNIKNVADNDIMNPTIVFVLASMNDCFLVCIVNFK